MEQVCYYTFFLCYRNFIDDPDSPLFPPDEAYFYKLCYYKIQELVYGPTRTSCSFTPYSHNAMVMKTDTNGFHRADGTIDRIVDMPRYDEDYLDLLDWYVMGLNGIEIGMWIDKGQGGQPETRKSLINKQIKQKMKAIADRDCISIAEVKAGFVEEHRSNRHNIAQRLIDAGFRLQSQGHKKYGISEEEKQIHIDNNNTQECTKCGKTKYFHEFYKRAVKIGRSTQCIECIKAHNLAKYHEKKRRDA